jgi:hypothetical protein
MADVSRRTANLLWIVFLACALVVCSGLGVAFLYFSITLHPKPIWRFILAIAWFLSVAGMALWSIRKRIQSSPFISN